MTTTIDTDPPAYLDGSGVLTEGEAWVACNSTLLGSDASTVTLTSTTGKNNWSQYMDLVLVTYCRSSNAAAGISAQIYFNNDTTSDFYRDQWWYGNGSGAPATSAQTTDRLQLIWCSGNGANSYIFSSSVFQMFDINSGKHKSTLVRFADNRNGSTGYNVGAFSGTWKKDQAISRLDLDCWNGNFRAGSRFDLFGILPRMIA